MRRLLILLLLPFLLFSCNRSGIGIFYSIREEQPLVDNTLDNTLSLSSIVKAGGDYIITAGLLFSKAVIDGAGGDWTAVASPASPHVFCSDMAFWNGKLYGIFSDSELDSIALFSKLPADADWEQIAFFDDKKPTSITSTLTDIFINVRDTIGQYSTYQSSDGAVFTGLALNSQYSEVSDAAKTLTETWLMSGANLYFGSGASYTLLSGAGAPASTSGFGGILYSELLLRVFVSSAEGLVFSFADGLPLTADSAEILDDNSVPIKLFDLAEIAMAGKPVIMVGAQNGYYDIVFESGVYEPVYTLEIPGSDAAGIYSSSDDNFLKVELRSSVVRFLFVDTAEKTIFACTSGNGLWINPTSGTVSEDLIRKWDRQ
ncbi:MAG: hypothetical protein HN368_20265 [Spirochaetales bacterium]|jgi:hypothetical protein|nr:hypothetical protein [Spirochaetales bacterium]